MEQYEHRLYSQQGEDGVIARIFELIGTDSKVALDIGAYDGKATSNVYRLEVGHGWQTVKWEGGDVADSDEAKRNGVAKEWVTAENVCELGEKYGVPKNLDEAKRNGLFSVELLTITWKLHGLNLTLWVV